MITSPVAPAVGRRPPAVVLLTMVASALVAAGAVLLLPDATAGAQGAQGAQGARGMPGAVPAAAGYVYDFRIQSGDGDVTVGRTHVLGDQSRIALDDEDGEGKGYLLLTDHGRTLVSVDPRKREYSTIDAASFERIAATAMKAVDRVMTLDVDDLEVNGERLGAGGRIAGRATRHGRLTQDFTVTMGVLGFNEDTRHHIVTDYWVADDLVLPRNPLFELFATIPAVLAQHDDDFSRRATAGRDALVGGGTPLRMVITAVDETKGKRPGRSTTTIEITSISTASPEASFFAIPSGYRKADGFQWKGDSQRGARR